MPLELAQQERSSLGPPALVANRVLDCNFIQDSTVIELNGDGVSNRALLGIMVIDRVDIVLSASDLGPQGVNARVIGRGISAEVLLEFWLQR
jgi:hypothetical protein